jgi:hypothetical protein
MRGRAYRRGLYRETTINAIDARDATRLVRAAPLPPEPWFDYGPRGGYLVATGLRARTVGEQGDDFIRRQMTVRDSSAGARRLRPGTKLYAQAQAELGHNPNAVRGTVEYAEQAGERARAIVRNRGRA